MPLYLVRWPDLAASLVKADDEDDLVDTLDEIANPDGCKWKVYRGPVFVHFELPAKVSVNWPEGAKGPMQAEYVQVEDVRELRTGAALSASVADGDTGSEMQDHVLAFAFPHLKKLFDKAEAEAEDRETLDRDAVCAAVKEDTMLLVSASWRAAQLDRAQDPDSKLAAAMDAPVSLVRYWRARQERIEREPPREPPKPRKKAAKKKPRRTRGG